MTMLDYQLTSRAKRDLAATRRWYDRQDPRVGNEFIEAAQAAVLRACRHPEAFVGTQRGIRSVLCDRFPYRVYYKISANRLVVVAVYHTARDPMRWDDPHRQ